MGVHPVFAIVQTATEEGFTIVKLHTAIQARAFFLNCKQIVIIITHVPTVNIKIPSIRHEYIHSTSFLISAAAFRNTEYLISSYSHGPDISRSRRMTDSDILVLLAVVESAGILLLTLYHEKGLNRKGQQTIHPATKSVYRM